MNTGAIKVGVTNILHFVCGGKFFYIKKGVVVIIVDFKLAIDYLKEHSTCSFGLEYDSEVGDSYTQMKESSNNPVKLVTTMAPFYF